MKDGKKGTFSALLSELNSQLSLSNIMRLYHECDLQTLLLNLFPLQALPIQPSELLQLLATPGFGMQVDLAAQRKFIYAPVTTDDQQESSAGDDTAAAVFLDDLCRAIDALLKARNMEGAKRFWTAKFGSIPYRTKHRNRHVLSREPHPATLESRKLPARRWSSHCSTGHLGL